MKFKLYAINFLAILLTCIIGANVFYLYMQPNVNADSGETSAPPVETVVEEPETILEEEIPEVLEKKRFSSFRQAYDYSLNYLYSSKGYTSVSRGSSWATASIIEILQTMYIYKQVNNRTSESYVKTYSKKLKTFGTNTSLQYYQTGDNVYFNQGSLQGNTFVFPDKTYTSTTFDNYVKMYGMSPVRLIAYLTTGLTLKNERMQNDGAQYILTFEVPFEDIAMGFILFLLQQLNSTHMQYDLQKGTVKFEMRIDYYGIIQTVNYTSKFNCYFPSIEEIGGIPVMSSGGFDITETFYNVNKSIKINNFTRTA